MESLGTYLKSERLARGVALDEVAAVTRVPVASLRSIEADDLDELPGEVFVRGFLRAYARCIQLDPEDILSRLDRPAPSPTMPLLPAPAMKNLRRRRIASPALLLVLILASILFTLTLWRPAAPPISANGTVHTAGTAG